MIIDKKFQVIAFNPISKNEYTENDGVFFPAGDEALPSALLVYIASCRELGADKNLIASATLLRERVIEHQLAPSSAIVIDRKFEILAIRISNGEELTENDGMFFCAKDKAFISFLSGYLDTCRRLGLEERYNATLSLFTRVTEYQNTIECKVPDINSAEEATRCIGTDTPSTFSSIGRPLTEAERNHVMYVTKEQIAPLSKNVDNLNPTGSIGFSSSPDIESESITVTVHDDTQLNPTGSIGIGAGEESTMDQVTRGLTKTVQPYDESTFVPVEPPNFSSCTIVDGVCMDVHCQIHNPPGSPKPFESNGMRCQVHQNVGFSDDDDSVPGCSCGKLD